MVSRCAKYRCVVIICSRANTVEAGYPGIPRSINMGITCPAMQRLVFEGDGRKVRLSANACQLHRPNTIPIFCAVVCRDYRLRTFITFTSKFLFPQLPNLLPQLLRALYHSIKRAVLVQVHHKNPDWHRDDHAGYSVNLKTKI